MNPNDPNDPNDEPGTGSGNGTPDGAKGPGSARPNPPRGAEGGQREHWILPGQLPDRPVNPRPPGEPPRPPVRPVFNRPGDEPRRPSVLGTLLKVIGWLIAGVAILIALAFGTCLLIVMTHK